MMVRQMSISEKEDFFFHQGSVSKNKSVTFNFHYDHWPNYLVKFTGTFEGTDGVWWDMNRMTGTMTGRSDQIILAVDCKRFNIFTLSIYIY